jgi:hypothetical protein
MGAAFWTGIILFDSNLSTAGSFAGEPFGFDLAETNLAVFGGMNGEVAAHVCAWAGLFGFAYLADQNFASANILATKTFDSEALAS